MKYAFIIFFFFLLHLHYYPFNFSVHLFLTFAFGGWQRDRQKEKSLTIFYRETETKIKRRVKSSPLFADSSIMAVEAFNHNPVPLLNDVINKALFSFVLSNQNFHSVSTSRKRKKSVSINTDKYSTAYLQSFLLNKFDCKSSWFWTNNSSISLFIYC